MNHCKLIYLITMWHWEGRFPSDSFYKCWKQALKIGRFILRFLSLNSFSWIEALHTKMNLSKGFLHSVNRTKSVADLVTFTEKIVDGKLHLSCSEVFLEWWLKSANSACKHCFQKGVKLRNLRINTNGENVLRYRRFCRTVVY